MDLRPLVISAVLVALASSPGLALAQGRRHGMGTPGDMSRDSSTMRQMEPLLQQMGGLMQQMAEQIKAGPLTPDQTLQLSTLMERLAGMMTKLGSGAFGSDTATQLEGMRTRLTEMQQGLATLRSAPPQKP
jgi:hypothetical protein